MAKMITHLDLLSIHVMGGGFKKHEAQIGQISVYLSPHQKGGLPSETVANVENDAQIMPIETHSCKVLGNDSMNEDGNTKKVIDSDESPVEVHVDDPNMVAKDVSCDNFKSACIVKV
ncbi:hypothetical protein MTR67_018567, partial [Solanum verrucosum]